MGINAALSASLQSRLHEQNPAWTWWEVAEILIKTRKLIEDPKQWMQNPTKAHLTFNAHGHQLGAGVPREDSRFTLQGALDYVGQGYSVENAHKARDILAEECIQWWWRLLRVRNVWDWNNLVSHKQVLAGVDRAIARARRSG